MQVSSRAMTYQPTENFQFKNEDFHQASKLDPLKNERLHPGYCDGSVQTSRDCSIFARFVYNSSSLYFKVRTPKFRRKNVW